MTSMRPPNKTTMLKVVILGNGGIGKSCLMNRFVANTFDEHSFHTIGVEFLNKDLEVDGQKYTLQIWDTAGQERFRALRTPFYRGSDICLLSYAVDDDISFQGIMQWREEFLKYADIKSEHFPFIVVGNKNDIPAADRQVTQDEVARWCLENGISSFIETSAKQSNNVSAAFELAVRQWQALERGTERELRAHGDTIDLTRGVNLAGDQSSCCTRSSSGGSRGNSAQNSPRTTRPDRNL